MPKLDNLRQTFPELYREQPVLVNASTQRIAADGSTVASIFRIRLSRTVSTSTANSRRSANASSTGSPTGPVTSVAPWPR